MSATVWLASYPKSGNTWFRMLVANLGADAPIDINALPDGGGIASARGPFERTMLFPSGLLTHEECDALRPRVHAAIAAERSDDPQPVRFVKTHDAWTVNPDGRPLLGGSAAAAAAILIVRDPRDVVASLANHNGQSIDDAIAFMLSPDAGFCVRRDRQPNQMRQQLPGWSGFHAGWLEQRDLPVHVVRYEDLHADPAGCFAAALAAVGMAAGAEAIARAIAFADFAELKTQEQANGFCEAPRHLRTAGFFRQGMVGGWRHELTDVQRLRIETANAAMMARFGYACAA